MPPPVSMPRSSTSVAAFFTSSGACPIANERPAHVEHRQVVEPVADADRLGHADAVVRRHPRERGALRAARGARDHAPVLARLVRSSRRKGNIETCIDSVLSRWMSATVRPMFASRPSATTAVIPSSRVPERMLGHAMRVAEVGRPRAHVGQVVGAALVVDDGVLGEEERDEVVAVEARRAADRRLARGSRGGGASSVPSPARRGSRRRTRPDHRCREARPTDACPRRAGP